MAIINDYADIRARMKGDLKAEPKPEPEIIKTEIPTSRWRELVMGGFDSDSAPVAPPRVHLICPDCQGTGRDMHHVAGGLCPRCNGKGHF